MLQQYVLIGTSRIGFLKMIIHKILHVGRIDV